MQRGGTGEYSYTDNSRTEWKDRRTETDTLNVNYQVSVDNYILTDADGTKLYRMKLKLTANNCIMPAQPVYYRVRRASSAVWGWDHEFAGTTQVYRHNYLAPLATSQAEYTLDNDFANNRKVHFNLKIENADVTYQPVPIEDCILEYKLSRSLSDTATIVFRVADTLMHSVKMIQAQIYSNRTSCLLTRTAERRRILTAS